ncbi:hypothetical protein ALC57_07905 [Trachymyrmex cornetzi]|uniref:Uncharacterized protein n=1 Tax=Trachymyrmex cornetzi TaxID=471704 RepID=A0A151J7I3_9HYME|nr:hypothetical protein ALC57_07905 [Trachymyrmex cornetzi]
MIDGKTCNVLTGQKSSNSCNICNANPSKMNDLSFINSLLSNEDNYKFGLSTLHCWIRFMEQGKVYFRFLIRKNSLSCHINNFNSTHIA